MGKYVYSYFSVLIRQLPMMIDSLERLVD